MSIIAFHRKITTQSVLAFILSLFGMALVMLALFTPPRGEIHPSVITVFGMALASAGAFLGIDLNFQLKSYLSSIQSLNHPEKSSDNHDTPEKSTSNENN